MEKRETITLDGRTQQRLYVLNHVLAGELTADEAGRVLKLSVRQVRRLRPAGVGLLRSPRDLHRREEPGSDARRAAHRQTLADPGRAVPRRAGIGRIGATPRRPRAGSNGPGAPSRIGSSSNCGWRRSRRSTTPTPSCPASSSATTTASRCPPASPSWPGGRGRRPRRGVGVLLPLSPPGRPGRDDQPAGRPARPAPAIRRPELGRPLGHPPGAARRQLVGQPRRDLPARRAGPSRSGHPPRPAPVATGRG